MSHAGGVEQLAVIVDNSRSANYLVLAVAVNVSSQLVVVAVAVSGNRGVESCVEYPALRQLLVHNVPSSNCKSCVVASSEAGAGLFAVKVGNAGCIALAAVAVVIAPCFLALFASCGVVVLSVKCLSGGSVEESDVLRS